MPTNRARARSKRRKRKIEAETSFLDILGEVFGNNNDDDDNIIDELANKHIDASKDSIPGQDEFMKRQDELNRKTDE